MCSIWNCYRPRNEYMRIYYANRDKYYANRDKLRDPDQIQEGQ